MILDTQHYYQTTGYSCAPTAFRMVLAGLGLDVPSDSAIESVLCTDPVTGTKYEDLLRAADYYGLYSYQSQDGTIELLDSLLEDGYMIIVGYHYYVPHAAVYMGSDEEHIYLHDPDIGPKYRMTKEDFMDDWEVDPKRFWSYLAEHRIDWPEDQVSKQWYIVFRKEKK